MQAPNQWALEFYEDEHGQSPVEDFLDGLDPRSRAHLRLSMEQLRLRNVRSGMPLARHLEGDLWELRRQSQGNAFRVIYFFFTGRRIVFLHGFQKKTRRTPAADIEIARRRQLDFLAREGS